MSGSRLVRGTRIRLFLYVGVVMVVGLAVYIFHGAQLELDDARKAADKCQQQQESLSAQLQVIFEYKLRLEKSLQQEKSDHRQTKEELESRANEERQLHEKENLESNNKYSSLQQHYKLLQNQHDDLREDCDVVRKKQLQGVEDQSKLESQVQAIQAEMSRMQAGHSKVLESFKTNHMKLEDENKLLLKQNNELSKGTSQTSDRINYLEKQNMQLERELAHVRKELESYRRNPQQALEEKPSETKNNAIDDTLKSPDINSVKAAAVPSSSVSSPAVVAPGVVNLDNHLNVLQEPSVNLDAADNKKSTTPQINPDAVLSQDRGQQSNNVAPVPPPRQEKLEEVKEQIQPEVPNLPKPAIKDSINWHHDNVPAGIVRAPHGFGFQHNSQGGGVNYGGGPIWNWGKYVHGPQPIVRAPVQDNNPLDDNGPDEHEEEEDAIHHHRSAQGEQQQEIPRQIPNQYHQYNGDYEKDDHRDLQLDEGEEEGDDDVDQIDYGNEADRGEGARHKVNKQPAVAAVNKKQHDGVMVNPK